MTAVEIITDVLMLSNLSHLPTFREQMSRNSVKRYSFRTPGRGVLIPAMRSGVMSRQLDILAIEPFHGGARRSMLEAIARYSRHRWRILKLPPRKMHRRLLVSS